MIDVDEESRAVIVQKFVNNQIRVKKYMVKIEQVILVEKGKADSFDSFPQTETFGHDEDEKKVDEHYPEECDEPFNEENDDQQIS